MNTVHILLILVGVFLIYVAVLLFRQKKKAMALVLIVAGLICGLYPLADSREKASDKATAYNGSGLPHPEEGPAQVVPHKQEVTGEPVPEGAVNVPQAAFKGDVEAAKYYANMWYLKATRLWDPGIVQYRLPDSVLFYVEKALYYTTFAEAYNVKGQVLVQQGEIKKGVDSYTTAISLNPELAQPYFNRGTAYYIMQEMDNACNDWKVAQQLGLPNAEQALATYCH